MHLFVDDVNQAFRQLVAGIYNGTIPTRATPSRYGDVLVVDEPATVTYRRPRQRVLFNASRDANPFFHLYESLWLLAGRNDVAPLTYYNSRMSEFSDDGKTFNGAYGFRWRHARYGVGQPGNEWYGGTIKDQRPEVDQLDNIVAHLKALPHSRRAVLQMWNVEDDLLKIGGLGFRTRCRNCYGTGCVPDRSADARGDAVTTCPTCAGSSWVDEPASKDTCCNLSALFLLRPNTANPECDCRGTGLVERWEDPKANPWGGFCPYCTPLLDLTVFNRSNDLIWGLLGANAVQFSFLQEYVACSLGAEVGRYHQVTNNLHVYTNNWQPAEWLAEYEGLEVAYPAPGLPLLTDQKLFDREVIEFVERHSRDAISTEYATPFLRYVAQPLCIAYHYYKRGQLVEAQEVVSRVEAEDWRRAAKAWLQRRLAKRQARSPLTAVEDSL